jgi:GNAT superfamily N-acetyltransferase
MPESLLLRRLTVGDHAALVALWIDAGLPCKPQGRDSAEEFERQLLLSQIAFFGLFDGHRMVGSALGTNDGRKGWVNRVAVHPDYRRRGLAKRLIHACEEWLASCGIGVFACLVEGWNEASRATVVAAGYELFEGVSYFTKRISQDS